MYLVEEIFFFFTIMMNLVKIFETSLLKLKFLVAIVSIISLSLAMNVEEMVWHLKEF